MSEEIDVDAIRARCEAATEGPWEVRGDDWECTVVGPGEGWRRPQIVAAGIEGDGGCSKADGEFIAHARSDIPALLEEIKRLRAEAGDR